MNQDDLVTSLKRIRKRLCAYIGDRCDCKFISPDDSDDEICSLSESGSGCPEVLYATMLIDAMTPEELYNISKRVGIKLEPSKKISKHSTKQNFSNETKEILDRLPDEIIFAIRRSFESTISNIDKQIKKATEEAKTQSKLDR